MLKINFLFIYLVCPLSLLSQEIRSTQKGDSLAYITNPENDPLIKRLIKERTFYDSLLSKQHFKTKLKVKLTNGRFRVKDGRFKDKDVSFRFKADRAYVVSNSSIMTQPSDDPSDFIGGNIHLTTAGNHFVFLLHFLHCVGESVHGCTNYSVTLEVPKLLSGSEIDLRSPEATAVLGYWHYGSFSGPVSSISSSGKVSIKDFKEGIVKGSLVCFFKNSDEIGFSLSGQFSLPVISYSVFDQFNQKIKK